MFLEVPILVLIFSTDPVVILLCRCIWRRFDLIDGGVAGADIPGCRSIVAFPGEVEPQRESLKVCFL